MALLELKDLTLALGGPPLLKDATLRVEKGERICLLGRNGEGKTTLLRLLSGELEPDSGAIHRQAGLRIGVLPQEVPPHLAGTIREIVSEGLAGEESWEADHAVDNTLSRAGLDPEADFATLSMGNKRRTLLARALVAEPDLLLLDEPTNHLDIDAIKWLEGQLLRFAGTLFFVTHDRAFLRTLARRILELDRGRLRDWTCDYDTFLHRRDQFLEDERAQQREFDKKLAREEIWIRKGVRERRTRNEGRVRALKQMRQDRQDRRSMTGEARIRFQDAERSGRLVIRAKGAGFSWGDLPIVRDFHTMILRGDKVGILGPNGAGKTTLLRLLLDDLECSSGTITRGTNLNIAYFDQQRAQLDESSTVQENISDSGDQVLFNGRSLHVITYLQNFLFAPDQARSPISHLSGGERNRLLLAKLFTQPANLFVLDEPTNDLDLETLELLEELLVEFDGTLLLVSHDREFLDNVATSTLVLEGEGRIAETVGGYSDWARVSSAGPSGERAGLKKDRKKSIQPDPAASTEPNKPQRLTYKERQELLTLPQLIETSETEQAMIQTQLSDPKLYQEASEKVGGLNARLQALETELANLYSRWEDLESRG
ncbi:MAG: ATP-binding cassette domain-containing protein [Gemmatimonadales bacterium]|nr:ATP-binding cassette domain-containing protein [Gemmatimonadales bacterium]